MTRRLLCAVALLLCACSTAPRRVTLLHFSDYHSHAVPFYFDGESDFGGIARAIEYLEPLSAREDVLIFNGGDTMNWGSPAWSDKYRCIEWPWWNGIVDAMAYGNHDADYGAEAFAKCVETIEYPILSGNTVREDGSLLFEPDGKPYAVFDRNGVRVGVLALAGADFRTLVTLDHAPEPEVRFGDRIEAARRQLERLRRDESVDLVVLIGHATLEEDEELARNVPGIDLILGTHSHVLRPLHRIEGTDTWMVSPGQYLTHVSRTDVTIGENGPLFSGELVPMTPDRGERPGIAEQVARLQTDLESDPDYSTLFRVLGRLESPLPNENVNVESSKLGRFVMDAVRRETEADLAVSTSSSFRGSLPAGRILEADLREVLPYDNRVVQMELSREELEELLALISAQRGTDSFCQMSGLRAWRDDAFPVTLVTTDYMARVSAVYSDFFSEFETYDAGITVREAARRALESPPEDD